MGEKKGEKVVIKSALTHKQQLEIFHTPLDHAEIAALRAKLDEKPPKPVTTKKK